MSRHAAIPAAQPHLSLSFFSRPSPSCEERNGECEKPSLSGAFASTLKPQLGRTTARQVREIDFGPVGVCRPVSRPLLGVTLRGYPAPCGTASFCFGFAALSGSRFLPEQACKRAAKNAAQTSSGPRQESTPWHLGAGPSRWLCHV